MTPADAQAVARARELAALVSRSSGDIVMALNADPGRGIEVTRDNARAALSGALAASVENLAALLEAQDARLALLEERNSELAADLDTAQDALAELVRSRA